MDAGVPVDDRGLAYGDGVFETLAVRDAVPLGFERHLRRLREGCVRLGFAAPPAERIESLLAPFSRARGRSVVKVIVTRGRGGRGYLPPPQPSPGVYVTRHAWPDGVDAARAHGVVAALLTTRLADNETLAGMKHLNRLEQVLASVELGHHPGAQEGIVRGADGRLVCGVMSNLFLVADGELVTPCLRRSGVAGIIRGTILELAGAAVLPPVVVRDVTADELDAAAEVFLTNSVRGVLPVRRVAGRTLPAPGPVAAAALAAIGAAGLIA